LRKGKYANISPPTKLANFSKLPPSQLPPRPSKEVLERLKFHKKNIPSKNKKAAKFIKLLYA